MDKMYQRAGADLVPVFLGGGSGIGQGALAITKDGLLVVDADLAGGAEFLINSEGMLEEHNG